MPWSILTELAPVTFHNRVDVPPELIADGILLNSLITEGIAAGGVVAGTGGRTVIQPIMRMTINNERKRNIYFFNVIASKNILSAI